MPWTMRSGSFGEAPVEARAFFGPTDNPLGIPLDVSAQLRFPSGGLATLALSYNAIVPAAVQRYTVIAEEDFLVYDAGRFTDRDGNVTVGGDERGRHAAAERGVRQRGHEKGASR